MKARHLRAAALALAIGVCAAAGLGWALRPQAAPGVAYTLLDGTSSSFAAHRGQVTLVNFWATTCAICVAEMPRLVATHERFRARGLQTVAVSMRHDPPSSVVDYARSRRLPFGVAIDNTGAIARAFGDVEATPTTLLIDRRGDIVLRTVGAPNFAALERRIEDLLTEP